MVERGEVGAFVALLGSAFQVSERRLDAVESAYGLEDQPGVLGGMGVL